MKNTVSSVIGVLGGILALARAVAVGPPIQGGLTQPESNFGGTLPATVPITTDHAPQAEHNGPVESIDDMPIKPMKTEFILKNGTTVVFIGSVEDIIPLINSMGLRDELINDPDCGSSDVENTEGSQGVQSTEGSGSKSSPKGVRRASSTWETYQYADLDCQLGEPIERWKIMKGISDVQAIKGNMRIEGFCSAVSCNDGAAIHACPNPKSDSKEPVMVSYNLVATMAEAITLRFCAKGWMTSGKVTDPQTPIAVYISKAEC